jgi:hypothetical protein
VTPRQFKAAIDGLGLSQGRAAKLCGFSTTRLATLGGKDQSRKKAAQLRACTSSRHGRDASTFSMRAFHAA